MNWMLFQFIGLQQYILFRTYCYRITLDPQQQFRIEQFENDFSKKYSYGVWTHYQPLRSIQPIGIVQYTESNCSLIHLAENAYHKVHLLYDVCFDYVGRQIIHKVSFFSYKTPSEIHTVTLEIDQVNEYENSWFYLHVACIPEINQVLIVITNLKTNLKVIQTIDEDSPFQSDTQYLQFGGSLKLANQELTINQLFTSFPGQIVIEELSYDYVDETVEDVFNSVQGFQGDYEFCSINSQDSYSLQLNQKLVIETANIYISLYNFQAWFRFESPIGQNIQNFEFLTIKPFKTFRSEIVIDATSLKLFYQISGNANSLSIKSYSYDFPLLNLDFSTNNPFLVEKVIEISEQLSQWHFITISKSQNSQTIQLQFFNENDVISYSAEFEIQQFTGFVQQIIFGEGFSIISSGIKLYSEQAKYDNCFESPILENICHYSCQTCLGPFATDCYTCSQNRQFNLQLKVCQCILGFMEINLECAIVDILNVKQVVNEFPNKLCKFGEYQLENECFLWYLCIQMFSPSDIEAQYINCYECVKDPNAWVQDPTCKTTKYYTEGQPVFQQAISIHTYSFVIANNELNLLGGCLEYELTESGIRCLKCLGLQYLIGNICVSPQSFVVHQNVSCRKNCASCSADQCYTCVNPKKYYVSLIFTNCKECTIEYCEYCFEFVNGSLEINSLIFPSTQYFDDVVQGCAKCEIGYLFNFSSLLCEPNISEPNCVHGMVIDGEFVCFETNLPYNSYKAIQYGQCQEYINNCQSCIINLDRFNVCIICDQGYYVQTKNGVCVKCELFMSKTCLENTFKLDYWLQELQAVYYYFSTDHTIYSRSTQLLYSQVLSCQDGYILVGNMCYSVCSEHCQKCIYQDNEAVCVDCGINSYGVIQRSTFDNKCIECSSFCEYCEPQDQALIKQWNPYFNSSSYLTNKCLKVKDNSNLIVLEKLYGITKYCDGIIPDCYLSSNVFINMLDCKIAQEMFISAMDQYLYEIMYFDADYLNFMDVYTFSVQFTFSNDFDPSCYAYPYLNFNFQNNLKFSVYSLRTTKIEVNSQSPYQFLDICQRFLNFNLILLKDLRLTIQNTNSYILCEQLEKDYTDLTIINTNLTFLSYESRGFTILIKNLRTLNLIQLIFDSIILMDEIIIDYTPFIDTEIIAIFIQNLTFINCQFNNTIFLRLTQLENQQIKLKIQNLKLINVTFYNSSIISFQNYDINSIEIISTIIHQSHFIKSKVFHLPYKSTILIDQFDISATNLIDTEVLLINSISQVNRFTVQKLNITNVILIQIQSYLEQTNVIQTFSNFDISECVYSEFQIIQNYIQTFTQIDIKVTNFNLTNLKAISKQINNLINFVISDILSNAHSTAIKIQRIIYQSLKGNVLNQVSFDQQCLTYPGDQGLIYISTFYTIELSDISVFNQRFIDINAIYITFSKQFQYSDGQYSNIQLKQIEFTNNVLLKTIINSKMPMISIQSEEVIHVIMTDLKFINNFVNYYLATQIEIGNVLLVDVGLGNVTINQLYLTQNFVSNSSSTMIYINSYSLEIKGLVAKKLNIFKLEWYQQFLPQIKDEIYKEDFLCELFPQQSDTGLGLITVTYALITDGIIEDIQSYSTSIFQILGKQILQIELKNFTITNISSSLVSTSSIYGCFLIQALKSNLRLHFNDMTVINAFNRMESAFLTIFPSYIQNDIIVANISFLNVISLKNSIISIGTSLAKISKIQFNNISIKVQLEVFDSFFKSIQTLELGEQDQLGTLNAIILIQSSEVTVSNLLVQGYFNIPIIQIVKCQKISMNNVQFHSIHTLQSLILIQSLSVFVDVLVINNLVIKSVIQDQIQHYNSEILQCPLKQVYSYKILTQCNIQYDQSTAQKIFDSNSLIYQKQCDSQIQTQLYYSIFGLIMIDVQQIQLLSILNVKIDHNICKFCSLGLLVVKSKQIIQKMRIDTFECFNNNMNNFGCIYIQGVQSNNSKYAEINKAKFISNKCDSGCALTIDSQPVSLSKSKIFNNIAQNNGGGINELSEQYNITQNNVIYLDNQAKFGGAIYIKYKILNISQLNQVYYSNNTNVEIYAQPIVLCLTYFTITIPSFKISDNNFEISQPNYNELSKVLNQNGKQYFMIPSNQYFYQYSFFNAITRKQQQVITSLYFQALNQFYETITDLDGTICSVQQRNFDLDLNQSQYAFMNFSSINFDPITSRYRLDNLLFSIDPYNPQNIVQQILIECPSIYNDKYRYLINLRSYHCQIGEYYMDNGCSICQSQKGYYSLKANQSKCQQVDFQKVKSNTGTDIELLPGFWRPSYGSELIEICIRKQINCKGGWVPGKDSCISDHLGALCEECDISNINGDGRFFKDSGLSCVNCKLTYQPILTMVCLSFWTIFSIFLTKKSMEQQFNQFQKFQRQSKHFILLYKYSQDMAGCLIKIVINQLLVISSIITNSIRLNIDISFLFYVSQPTLTNSYKLDCFLAAEFADQMGIVYVRQLVNLLIPFSYLSVYFSCYFMFVIYKKIPYSLNDLFTPVIYIFVISQPDIIQYCGSLLASRFISGLYWVQADVSLLYWTDNHQKWTYYATLPILFFWSLVLPLVFTYQLWKHNNQLRNKNFRKRWGYLYDEYTEKSYYWEILKIVQRQFQILILTLFYDNIILKLSLLIFIQTMYYQLIIKQKPFNTNELNTLEIRCVSLCIYILIVTLVIINTQNDNQKIIQYILQSLLLLLILANILPILYKILLSYTHKYQEDIIIFLDKMQNIFPRLRICFGSLVDQRFRLIAKKQIIKKRFNLLRNHLLKQSKKILEIKNTNVQKKQQIRSNHLLPSLQLSEIKDESDQQIVQKGQLISIND